MASIVRQLMDFARSRPVQREPIGLRGLAERSVRLVEAMARERGATITVDAAGGDPVAFADEGQLQQALLNIVINALHAVGRGGTIAVAVDTVAAAAPPDRNHGTTARGPWARLCVRDTGVGMDPATMARIFEPFFTTKGVGEGTGLGLSVTYGIVRDAGGWIDVESAPGAGSVFTLYLPPAPPGAPA
jgi:signal transduction histidine kinase